MKTLLLLLLTIGTTSAEDIVIYQAGKTFLPKLSDEKFSTTKNSRGKFIKSEVRKHVLKEVKLKVGDSIEFHNKDNVIHNVFGVDFSYNQELNSVNKKTFTEKGTRTIRCAIHPKMKLKVVVE